jgi:catechol 2,3-dioxygenase-like lactoylglutathione lyase family enzyme
VSEPSVVEGDFTHVALQVRDLEASLAFYRDYGQMRVFDQRGTRGGGRVAWLASTSQRFVLVLVAPRRMSLWHRLARLVAKVLPPANHLGIELASREEVEQLCERARREGILRKAPGEHGPPVGFYGMLSDPDGNNVELSHDQATRAALDRAS